jgi:phage shock protein PspC (stress-responsive transcriptional regulator)
MSNNGFIDTILMPIFGVLVLIVAIYLILYVIVSLIIPQKPKTKSSVIAEIKTDAT